jgi:M-phase inducer tyrosine phosphatase
MDNFRKGKWGRTRSYTYGEPAPSRSRPNSLSALSQSHRNTAPGAPSGGHMFAAANAARLRRGGTLDEALAAVEEHDHDHDHDADTSGSAEHGIDESPCPTGGSARIIGARLTKAFTLPAF